MLTVNSWFETDTLSLGHMLSLALWSLQWLLLVIEGRKGKYVVLIKLSKLPSENSVSTLHFFFCCPNSGTFPKDFKACLYISRTPKWNDLLNIPCENTLWPVALPTGDRVITLHSRLTARLCAVEVLWPRCHRKYDRMMSLYNTNCSGVSNSILGTIYAGLTMHFTSFYTVAVFFFEVRQTLTIVLGDLNQ